tara:strand:- start:164 stop:472 length:309 start_codon:yes stop_codon:yes gene_type:complete
MNYEIAFNKARKELLLVGFFSLPLVVILIFLLPSLDLANIGIHELLFVLWCLLTIFFIRKQLKKLEVAVPCEHCSHSLYHHLAIEKSNKCKLNYCPNCGKSL